MKKILTFLLLMAMVLSLTACNQPVADFFEEAMLQQFHLSGLPAPELKNAQRDGATLYCNLSDDGYASYAQQVAEYLKTRTDIYHFSFLCFLGLEGDIFPYDVYSFLPENYDFSAASHTFAFSTTEEFDRYSALHNPIRLEIRRENGTRGNHFSYNTVIAIQPQNDRGVRFEYCAARHTYNEGKRYPIPGTDQFSTIRTCVYCGTTTHENFTSDMQTYKITLKGSLSLIYRSNRVLDYCTSGLEIEISVQALENADAVILVNGEQIPRMREENGVWIYGFTMPQQDITIEISTTTK